MKGRSQANAVAQQALAAHWQSIVKSLNNYLKMMKANYVSTDSLRIFARTGKMFYGLLAVSYVFCLYRFPLS